MAGPPRRRCPGPPTVSRLTGPERQVVPSPHRRPSRSLPSHADQRARHSRTLWQALARLATTVPFQSATASRGSRPFARRWLRRHRAIARCRARHRIPPEPSRGHRLGHGARTSGGALVTRARGGHAARGLIRPERPVVLWRHPRRGHARDAHSCVPNSGRSEGEYLCGGLYVIYGRSDRQFSIVIRIGGRAVRRIGAASTRAPPCGATGLSADRAGKIVAEPFRRFIASPWQPVRAGKDECSVPSHY